MRAKAIFASTLVVLLLILPLSRYSTAASPAESLEALRDAREWVRLGYAYLEILPGDIRGYRGLAMTYIEQYKYAAALKALEPALADSSPDSRLLPVAAQAHAALGDVDLAVALFQKVFHALPDSERALYEDLSLVTFPAELETYKAKSGKEKEEWLRAFWKKRDMALVSAGRVREAEHFRRVWYARTFFGEKVFPWDLRA